MIKDIINRLGKGVIDSSFKITDEQFILLLKVYRDSQCGDSCNGCVLNKAVGEFCGSSMDMCDVIDNFIG